METIDSAVIGCGRMGAFTSEIVTRYCPPCWMPLSHIQALLASDEISLVAICDPDQARLDRAKSAYDIAVGYADYRELLREVSPTLLSIATRTAERTDIISQAIDCGVKAIHIEKPLCNSVAQLDHLDSLFARSGVLSTYGTIRRHFNIYRRARDLVLSGDFGALEVVQVNLGKGQLFWTHPHSVDLMLFFAGERQVESVYANLSDIVLEGDGSRIDSDPIVNYAAVSFEGGLTGVITGAGGYDVILACSKGIVTVESDGYTLSYRVAGADDIYWRERHVADALVDSPEGTYGAIGALVDALKDRSRHRAVQAQRDMLLGQRILFAMVQSQLCRRAVGLGEIDKQLVVTGRTGTNYA